MSYTTDPCDRCGAAVLLGGGTITTDRDGRHFICPNCCPIAARAIRAGYCIRADADDIADAEALAAVRD